MYAKYKQNQDSLVALQRDINLLGFEKYVQAKKTKIKNKAKAEKSKENSIESISNFQQRLPSLYEKSGVPQKKFGSLHGDASNSLIQRIKEFQNRINDLQIQNAIHKRQNQKLIEHVASFKNGSKGFNDSRRTRETQPKIQQPYYPQFPPQYPFSPYMSPMMPYQNMNPYSPAQMSPMNQINQMNPNNPYQNQSVPHSYKKQKPQLNKIKLISKFRIIGYVVFFAFFFKKYAKSFTLNRFDHFKESWPSQDTVFQSRRSLCDYFRRYIPLKIFQNSDINELDSLRNLEDQSKKKKKKAVKSEQSDSNSADSSDLESQQSQKKGSQKQKSKKQSKVFQFYLKIDIAVAFVIEFIKEIAKVLENGEFQEKNTFLTLLLPMQFQMDRLHQDSDLNYLNQHFQKGYSQNDKAFTEYLLVKNIFLSAFVQYSLINEFGKRFYIDKNKKSNEKNENRVFFSFYIRTSIFKLMIENYLEKKLKKIKQCPLPKEELRPFTKELFSDSFMKNRILSFKNNGIDMEEENILEISQEEMKKKQLELKAILDEACVGLMKRLMAFRKKKHYQPLKEKTLSQKYRTEDNNYFKLHEKSQIAQQRENKIAKPTKSILESTPTISSDNISIVNRIKQDSRKTKGGTTKGKTKKGQKTRKKAEQQDQDEDI